MDNIFIAIGGSGTKVAEALVRLLAAGCPTRRNNGSLTSEGQRLIIWRIDPDASAGANDQLQRCVTDYRELQGRLSNHWAMNIEETLYSNPFDLLTRKEGKNEVPSLEGILADTGADADRFLNLFYTIEELKIRLNRGFYQKPFIGAAVMALFAESLANEQLAGRSELDLNHLKEQPANFFLCGSLHGGTGACGLPVIGKFLNTIRKKDEDSRWKITACLLAPYCLPPPPPFPRLSLGEKLTEELIDQRLREWDNADPKTGSRAIHALGAPEEKRQLVRQILLGFYADPIDVPDRARQSLLYYSEEVVRERYFDNMYLVGKPQPDRLLEWSNGGSTQTNPLNTAEVVAAIAALNFFSGTQVDVGKGNYTLAASTSLPTDAPQTVSLSQLPHYQINDENIDVERVLLATGILCHFLRNELPWDVPARHWSGLEGLRRSYLRNEPLQVSDRVEYADDITRLSGLVFPLFDGTALGWEPALAGSLRAIMSGEAADRMEPIGKGNDRAIQPIVFGRTQISVSTFEMGKWLPAGEHFSRGQYLRHLWSNLYLKSLDSTRG